MEYRLEEIAMYSNEKIEIDKINFENYISTENMLSNKLGITKATTLPNQSKVNFFEKQNILISNIRPYFKKIWFADFRGGCSNDVLNIVVKDATNVLPKFLYYNLFRDEFFEYVMSGNKGTKMPRGDKQHIMQYIINIPSIGTQSKIVNILEKIDQKIDINNQINGNLYEISKAIYHNYIDQYSDLLVNRKIVDIAKRIVTGKTPSTKNENFWNGNIPFITIPDMHNQVFTIDTERRISNIGAKAMIPKNSLSVSCIATIGLVSISTEESQTNQQINSIILDHEYDLYYLFEYLSEKESFLKSIAGGSTTYNINKNIFGNIEIPYLPKKNMIEFNNLVCDLFNRIKLNQKENKKLEQLRDTLLPKLMNAEINLNQVFVF